MNHLKKDPNRICYLVSVILGASAAVLIPASQISYHIANGFFFSGMLLLLWGLIRMARHMGSGDLFLYSEQRFRQLLDKEKNNTVRVKSYYEYLAEKPEGKPYIILILSGALLFLFSVIIAIVA